MPGKVLLLLLAMVSCVLGAGYLLSSDNTANFQWLVEHFGTRAHPPAAEPLENTKTPPRRATTPPQPPSDNALGFMLASVADQYVQNSRYPPWSTPLTEAQARAYQGNHYAPVDLPLGNRGHFTVTLEKYRFTQGEPILILASLSGPQVVGNGLEASLEHSESRDTVASTKLTEADASGYYEGSLDSDEDAGEYRLIVEAAVDGKPVRHVSTLTIEPHLGDFEGMGEAYVENNNLVIPVHFSPEQPGYYALSAQLYAGQRPIAQLQAEQRLDLGADTIVLKAHGTVLANQDIEGELAIRHLQVRQLPARPGDRTHYAFGPEEGYSFSPPDLTGLRDTPAGDPESEQRAALLRQLADKF